MRISTGCVARPIEVHPPEAAEQFLKDYIASKYAPSRKLRDVDLIPMADVLLVYHADRREDRRRDTAAPIRLFRRPPQ